MLTENAERLLHEIVPEGAEMEMRREGQTDRRVLLALTRNVRVDRSTNPTSVFLRPVVMNDNDLDVARMTARTFQVVAGDVIDGQHGLVGLQVTDGRYVVVRPVSQATVEHLRAWDRYWVRMPSSGQAIAAALAPGG